MIFGVEIRPGSEYTEPPLPGGCIIHATLQPFDRRAAGVGGPLALAPALYQGSEFHDSGRDCAGSCHVTPMRRPPRTKQRLGGLSEACSSLFPGRSQGLEPD